jgi:hypothetical protein
VDPSQNLIYVPLLTIELETLAPSWAISNAPTHLISIPAWERYVVLDQTLEIWISLFVFNVDVVVSSSIMLHVED